MAWASIPFVRSSVTLLYCVKTVQARITIYLLQSPNYSPFVSNFVATATRVGRGKIMLAAFDGSTPKTPYRLKGLAKISSRNRVIANFVPNFVAMATRENPG